MTQAKKTKKDLDPKFCLFFFSLPVLRELTSERIKILPHFGGMDFYSECLLVCTYSELIFKLFIVINDATTISFKSK